MDEEDSVVGTRSDPDDKIAINLGNKSTTENRIATRVISTVGPDLMKEVRDNNNSSPHIKMCAVYSWQLEMYRFECRNQQELPLALAPACVVLVATHYMKALISSFFLSPHPPILFTTP